MQPFPSKSYSKYMSVYSLLHFCILFVFKNRSCLPSPYSIYDDLLLFCEMQVVIHASNAYPKDPEAPQCGVDDMTKLAYLHEPGVLQNLKSRYDINEIYVSIFIRV